MKDVYIISDVHGNYEDLEKALELIPKENSFVVQIGDLANCVEDSVEDDLRCLNMVGKEIDLMLIGNHEIPYFDANNTFVGFHFARSISDKLWDLYKDGRIISSYVPSHLADVLVTHAGISQSQLNLGTGTTPLEVSHKLLTEWRAGNFGHYLFRDCGRARYGLSAIGGVLWCDFDTEFEPTEFPQIVGHTPGVLRKKGNALCIDTGAKYGGQPTVLKIGG